MPRNDKKVVLKKILVDENQTSHNPNPEQGFLWKLREVRKLKEKPTKLVINSSYDTSTVSPFFDLPRQQIPLAKTIATQLKVQTFNIFHRWSIL